MLCVTDQCFINEKLTSKIFLIRSKNIFKFYVEDKISENE